MRSSPGSADPASTLVSKVADRHTSALLLSSSTFAYTVAISRKMARLASVRPLPYAPPSSHRVIARTGGPSSDGTRKALSVRFQNGDLFSSRRLTPMALDDHLANPAQFRSSYPTPPSPASATQSRWYVRAMTSASSAGVLYSSLAIAMISSMSDSW